MFKFFLNFHLNVLIYYPLLFSLMFDVKAVCLDIRVEHLKDAPLMYTLDLFANIRLGW